MYKILTGILFITAIMVIGGSKSAMADCANPVGVAGEQIYNADHNVMQYCDGTDWVGMGGGSGGGGGADCGLPWGGSIANGEDVTAYQEDLPSGAGCVSETRTCNNGALLGTYLFSSCSPGCAGGAVVSWSGPASGCFGALPTGSHGQTGSAVDPAPPTCGSGVFGSRPYSCSNGTWSAVNGGTCTPYQRPRDCTSCFAAGSMVLMADGTNKSIDGIKVGEYLMGSDGKPTRVVEYDRPIMEHRDGDPQRLISINDKGYLMTNNHPVLTTDGWKALWVGGAESEAYDLLKGKVSQLGIGDEIIMTGDKTMVVETIDVLEHTKDTRLYNFVLEGDPVFYVDGMAVMSFVADKGGKYTAHLEHDGEPK